MNTAGDGDCIIRTDMDARGRRYHFADVDNLSPMAQISTAATGIPENGAGWWAPMNGWNRLPG
jgi:hypothetical protein